MRQNDSGILRDSRGSGKPGWWPSLARHLLSADTLVVAILCVIALIVLAPLMASVHIVEYDEAIFLDVARNIQRLGLPLRSIAPDGVFSFEHTPLYPYLLSLYAQDSDRGLFLARLATVLAALAAVALTYRFGARFNGRRTGVLAALLLAINPFFAVYAFFVRMEILMLLALLAGFYTLAVGLEEKKSVFLLASGISFAAAVLFKEFALVGTIVAAAYALWWLRGRPREALAAALIVGTPSLVALAGWAAWSWKLSPVTFAATMQRWLESATSTASLEPRVGLSWIAWGSQIGSRLLGAGLVLGLLIALWQWVPRRGRESHLGLLWAYTLAAIVLSFFTSLKEPRHLIAILPAVALLTAHALGTIWDNWGAKLSIEARKTPGVMVRWVKPVAAILVIVIVFVLASPLRPPLLPRYDAGNRAWLAPVYAERLANDDFYHVLAVAGKRVETMTAPGESVTVVHQAPVVAYYADRPYTMLYTLPSPAVDEALQSANVLVWDAPTFLALTGDQVERVQAAVASEFTLKELVSDDRRSVGIYERKVNHD